MTTPPTPAPEKLPIQQVLLGAMSDLLAWALEELQEQEEDAGGETAQGETAEAKGEEG